ncbi:MAG: hypothetical protein O2856_19550 [Planctomycetota bacterium]|nr:hypothetical protein [Planctomycetota bacterium]
MFDRTAITLSLLCALFLAIAICLGYGVHDDVLGGPAIPVVFEEEEIESSDESEFDTSWPCDLYSLSNDSAACLCEWHQLTIEATDLLHSLPLQTAIPRGPPSV